MKHGGPLRRRTRLHPTSEKRRGELEARRDVRMAVLARDRGCRAQALWPEIACGGSLEVDEVVPRGRGGDWLDPGNCWCLCRNHHFQKHHGQVAEAERRGLYGEAARAKRLRRDEAA